MSESSRCVWVIFLRAGAVLPFIAILGESGPLFEVRWDVKRFEGLLKRVVNSLFKKSSCFAPVQGPVVCLLSAV